MICKQIAVHVRTSKFFSLSADEATDVNKWKQLCIVLHYIKDGLATERLAEFVALVGVCGFHIFQAIKCFPS